LRSAITVLRDLAQNQREVFCSDYRIYGLAERYLQQAIEACLSLCCTLIATLGLRRAEAHHELLSIIANQQIITRALAYRLEILANLRVKLVHEPDELNHEVIYEDIQHHLEDLEEFARMIEQKQT
jgi:uncharacterized protein YutE (UPF0331/DUF86 family)